MLTDALCTRSACFSSLVRLLESTSTADLGAAVAFGVAVALGAGAEVEGFEGFAALAGATGVVAGAGRGELAGEVAESFGGAKLPGAGTLPATGAAGVADGVGRGALAGEVAESFG